MTDSHFIGGIMATVAEKKLTKRIKLIDSAYDLFLEKGVNITAIDEIVKKAGVAKGTFYLYFKDKYDLLDEIVIYRSKLIFKDAMESLEKKTAAKKMDLTEQIKYITDFIIEHFKKNSEIVSIIKKNLASCLAVIFEDEKSNEKLKPLFSMFYENGFSSDETEKLIYLIFNMISSACCDSILLGKPYTTDEILPQIHFVIERITQSKGENK